MSPPSSTLLLGPPTLHHAPDPTRAQPDPEPITEDEPVTPLPASSGNPCLDFFFNASPSAAASLLPAAWAHHPLTALKLVANLRAVRGTGKNDRESFYACAVWLHRNHPRTLALNVGPLAHLGYMKDLLEILRRLLHGPRPTVVPTLLRFKKGGLPRFNGLILGNKTTKKKAKSRAQDDFTVNGLILDELKELNVGSEKPSRRVQKTAQLASRAVETYSSDESYQFLYERVAEFFAGLLGSDLAHLRSGNPDKVSLAAKWCPSLDSSFDKSTLLCERIASLIFPRDSDPEYANIEDAHYAYRVRTRLKREVLVPLRNALELPEAKISSSSFGGIDYSKVPSVAMTKYADKFNSHDRERFAEFLKKVREGEATVAAGALLPHEIMRRRHERPDIAELQWRRMVQDLAGRGRFKNCIAVCDFTYAMRGEALEACVALGLLISELSEEPWKGRVITRSYAPCLHKIEGETLLRKADSIARATGLGHEMATGYGYATVDEVFDKLLKIAATEEMDKSKMVKRVFLFGDGGGVDYERICEEYEESEYGDCVPGGFDYERICKKYEESGYGDCVPEIVFWKLGEGSEEAAPAVAGRRGVAMVSGYSRNLVRVFLEKEGVFSPEDVMESAIAGEEYQKLEVFD